MATRLQAHPTGPWRFLLSKTSPRLARGFLFKGKSGVYGNPWFSVQAGACTEIISFPYTRSGLDPPSSKFGLNHHRIAPVRKTVPFGTPASPAAIRSAFMIEVDQTLAAAACPQMNHGGTGDFQVMAYPAVCSLFPTNKGVHFSSHPRDLNIPSNARFPRTYRPELPTHISKWKAMHQEYK